MTNGKIDVKKMEVILHPGNTSEVVAVAGARPSDI